MKTLRDKICLLVLSKYKVIRLTRKNDIPCTEAILKRAFFFGKLIKLLLKVFNIQLTALEFGDNSKSTWSEQLVEDILVFTCKCVYLFIYVCDASWSNEIRYRLDIR